jgi:hypothetical protein
MLALRPACALPVNELRNTLQPGNVLVFPYPQIRRRNAAFGQHSGCLKNHQPRAALCTAAQVHQMPVIGKPVF